MSMLYRGGNSIGVETRGDQVLPTPELEDDLTAVGTRRVSLVFAGRRSHGAAYFRNVILTRGDRPALVAALRYAATASDARSRIACEKALKR
jgi:hypothetical protein